MFTALFFALIRERYADDGLPPVPVCATLTTPLINAGGKAAYRIHPHTIQQTALQIPICRATERYRAGGAARSESKS